MDTKTIRDQIRLIRKQCESKGESVYMISFKSKKYPSWISKNAEVEEYQVTENIKHYKCTLKYP